MKPADLIHETITALSSNYVRTGLTMLGIIIGIASVIAMVSIGQGAQSTIESNIKSIGANLVTVSPGAQRGPGFQPSQGRGTAKTLKLSDADAITEKVQNILAVSPEVSGRYQVSAGKNNTNTSVNGVQSAYPIVRNIEIDAGAFISDNNVRSGAKVAVLGPTTRDDLFGVGEEVIGKSIRIKNVDFRIVGVTVAKGGSGFQNPDDIVLIPITTAQRYFSGDEYVSNISVAAIDADSMALVQADITALLMELHNIEDETAVDFSVINQSDIVAAASSVTGTFTILLAAIAGISLVVGGIGIMNMMLTTVTERTKEIGLRKAIGAKRRDINRQFLAEAVALTFIGGLIGVILGCLIGYAVSLSGLLQTSISVSSILIAFGVSALIGIVFGYYPARRAAAMNPIEALRYE